MSKQPTLQDFKLELQLFFEKNSQELLAIFQLISDFNAKSYPIDLGKELMDIIGSFLATYEIPNLKSETNQRAESAIKLFPVNTDKSSLEKIDNKSKKAQNSESLWKYKPISNAQPKNHSETYFQKIIADDNNWQLIGASVRGKSHKHKGTNRDDWFEFTTSGKWQIITVADGAGSKVFSRLGAKISCKAAVKKIEQLLENHQLQPCKKLEELKQNNREDVELIYQAIAQGVLAAYQAVNLKAEELQDSVTYYKALNNRRLELSDLAATLLIAIRTTIEIEGEEYSFIFSHQIGDGVIAAVSQQDNLHLLGLPDSGSYAGQTNFLTSGNKHDANFIRGNIKTFLGKLKTLMVMSDGVSDDYFPNSPKILSLYGDLVLNQIIPDSRIPERLPQICLDREQYIIEKQAEFCERHQVSTDKEVNSLTVAYLDKLAQLLEIREQESIASPLLAIAAKVNPIGKIYLSNNVGSAERLRNWLDAYYRRGSFDDRTLVVLYQQ